ncbi:MAG: hypothetical protein IBX48_05420 [Thiomicrospira sp.]|uniref:hypothetical protein n=1 Tax=Thiomicrospira sp. TaxID=935 RepID=UPI0019EDD0F9|nr:hypothetical protein [Thiomicrospira sp.]MBE0493763.1 hypothetical protein [Thiomicrospira sp.]
MEDFENTAREHSTVRRLKSKQILEEAIVNEPLDTLIGSIETLHAHHLLWIKKCHIVEGTSE